METGREPETQAAEYMTRALALAERGLGLAPPNPLVGALLVKDGRVVGEGWHEGPGSPHAEMAAIAAAGEDARGATLYTTLEPCAHHGRTPPCAPAIVEVGVTEVVVAAVDPNPVVDGRGIRYLRDAGLRIADGVLREPAERMNAGFAKHVRTGLPYVTLKIAASLDGKTAARDGSSRWITGDEARLDAHRLRAKSGAIVVGAGTVVTDDPSLTVRLDGYRGRQPLRVVIDGRGRTPPTAAVLNGTAPTLMATTPDAPLNVRREWEEAGAEVVVMENGHDGSFPLSKLVELLGKRDVQDVLIEGGSTVAWAVVEAGLVDRLVLYMAPKLIGGTQAPGLTGGAGISNIAEAIPVTIRDVTRIGDDLKVVADVHRDR
ncbi:MAG TPA: bifunctional diaminohydroxyphosphoribosylaminopyrimidine deaminase/5-amino-6-(5-phosphoribosylamino)uracil reductase RibD [Actinomycetota bacterium]|nr:bifunctional diaminohydroxyphosphoribosylaminopyrimidine deaminase/5-amino-6-(5-phosphoribosylamino)uracil reductase RibD [Actinomycetota bacterium]